MMSSYASWTRPFVKSLMTSRMTSSVRAMTLSISMQNRMAGAVNLVLRKEVSEIACDQRPSSLHHQPYLYRAICFLGANVEQELQERRKASSSPRPPNYEARDRYARLVVEAYYCSLSNPHDSDAIRWQGVHHSRQCTRERSNAIIDPPQLFGRNLIIQAIQVENADDLKCLVNL